MAAAENVVSFNRELAEKEKTVLRMQKANEISQKKIKEYASEISNMQGTIKALTSQVSDQAAKEAANEEALEQLRLQLQENEKERDRLNTSLNQFNQAVDEKLAAKQSDMEDMRLSRARFEENVLIEKEELQKKLEDLQDSMTKRHASQMLWVQSLWVLKEKMSDEQLREANETIQMMSEDFRIKVGGFAFINAEWNKKMNAQKEELQELETKLQHTTAELDIKMDLANSLTLELGAQQALVKELNDKLNAVQDKSQKSQLQLQQKLQASQTSAVDEKNELNKMYQQKIQTMITEHTAAIEREQHLSSVANSKSREMRSLLEAAETRLSLSQTTSQGKISSLEAELEGVKTRLEHSRTQYEKRLDEKGKQLAQANDKCAAMRGTVRSLNRQVDESTDQIRKLTEEVGVAQEQSSKYKEELGIDREKLSELFAELETTKSQLIDGNVERDKAKDTIGMLANQTAALEGCVELQEKHITKLLEKLQAHAEETQGYREQMEKFDMDLKYMDEESGIARADAEHAQAEAKQLLERSRKTENECLRLQKAQRTTNRRLKEMEEELNEKNAEVDLLKEMLNSLKIQAREKRAYRNKRANPPPTHGRPPAEERDNRRSKHTSRSRRSRRYSQHGYSGTVPPLKSSRSNTPLILPPVDMNIGIPQDVGMVVL